MMTPEERATYNEGMTWLDSFTVETEGGPLPFGLVLPGILRAALREELGKLRVAIREEVAARLRDRETAAQ